MEDHNIGMHCKFTTCKQKDWLPVKCKYCSEVYCAEHSSIQSHNCPQHQKKFKKVYTCPLCNKTLQLNPNLTPTQNFEIHQAMDCQKNYYDNVKPMLMCHRNKCKTKLTELNQYQCGKCHRRFCLKHRIQQQHQCVKA